MRTYIALTVMVGAVAGCHGMQLPQGFVEVEKEDLGEYHVRAVSADGVVVALRTEKNPDRGTVEFWSKAVGTELTGRGYKLDGTEGIESATGEAGRLLTFSTRRQGAEFRYFVGVFVRWGRVLVAEAGGPANAMKEHADEVRKAFATVR